MSEVHSTPEAANGKATVVPRVKPAKPYPEFPLRAHAAGYWCKKIRGHVYYFGPWADPDGALAKYLEQKDDLHAGRTPRTAQAELTVKEAVNRYLNAKNDRVQTGELSARTVRQYKDSTDAIIAAFGKRRRVADLGPDDFAALRRRLAERYGPVRLGNLIQGVRSVFKFNYDSDLIDRPVRFGPDFKKPSKKVLRLHRAQQGAKVFTADEVRRILDAADQPMKAMILLGINGGMGNSDCGRLPVAALDLEKGWLDYPRPKTGIARRIPLWPETVQAIRNALACRPDAKSKDDAGLVFITAKYRQAWRQTAITHEFDKLMDKLGIGGHRSFYALRHTFRTEADGSRDQPAIDHIMGHARDDMASVYRERIGDDRLRAVANHVRAWLYAGQQSAPKAPEEEEQILKMEQSA